MTVNFIYFPGIYFFIYLFIYLCIFSHIADVNPYLIRTTLLKQRLWKLTFYFETFAFISMKFTLNLIKYQGKVLITCVLVVLYRKRDFASMDKPTADNLSSTVHHSEPFR